MPKKKPAVDLVAKRPRVSKLAAARALEKASQTMAIKQWTDDEKGHRGPCSLKKTCPIMRMALAAETRRGPGLGTVTLMVMGPKPEMMHRIVYRKGGADRGVVINFCPFCGQRVHKAKP